MLVRRREPLGRPGGGPCRRTEQCGIALSAQSNATLLWRGGSAGGEAVEEPALDLVEPDPLLRHRVAVADRHRFVLERLEVERDAVRRPDLVLSAVTPTDRAGIVEVDVPPLPQERGQITRLRRQVGVA